MRKQLHSFTATGRYNTKSQHESRLLSICCS